MYSERVQSDTPERFDLDLLDEADPFEIDVQLPHLFKHHSLGIDDIYDVWHSNPGFYPAKPPAHWMMRAEVGGRVLEVPLVPSRDGDVRRCRPIGCYEATATVAARFRKDRNGK